MATNWQTFPIKFVGGLRTDLGRLEQGLTDPGSAIRLENYEPSITGGYQKIKGYEKYSTTVVDGTGDPIIGVISYTETKTLARKGNTYYKSSGTTWTSVITAPVGGSTHMFFDIYNWNGTEQIVIVDGVEDPAFFNTVAETITYDTSAPADVTGATIVAVFKGSIFFGKNNLLTFTAPYNATDYTPANGAGTINVGAPITGLIVFRDELIIFTTDSIYRLAGNTSSDYVLQPITRKTGCLCQYTVQEIGGDIMYLGPDGVRWLSATTKNEDFGLDRASYKIQDKILQVINSNCGYVSLPIRSKNQYRLFTYVDATPAILSRGFIATKYSGQDVTNIAWSEIIGMKVYAAHSRQYRDREVILFASDTNYVYKMESSGGFDGISIPYNFTTPWLPINDPRVRFTLYKHTVYFKPEGDMNVDVNIKYDYNVTGGIQPPAFNITTSSGTSIYGSAIYGTSLYSAISADSVTNMSLGSGFVTSISYAGEDTNPPFNLDFAILEYMTNERR